MAFILRPGLAAALPTLRAIPTPLKRAFDTLGVQIETMINHAQLAPQNLTRLHQVSFLKQGARGPKRVKTIPIEQIRFLNPRVRNRRNFQEIVQSIANVGLKRPITVSPRKSEADSASYDLVCGQGRIEAFIQLGQTEIPAIVW